MVTKGPNLVTGAHNPPKTCRPARPPAPILQYFINLAFQWPVGSAAKPEGINVPSPYIGVTNPLLKVTNRKKSSEKFIFLISVIHLAGHCSSTALTQGCVSIRFHNVTIKGLGPKPPSPRDQRPFTLYNGDKWA